MKVKIMELSVFSALIISVIIGICTFESGCEQVRESVLRLHVIANSDSEDDQALKLKVRDAVLEAGKDVFGSGKTSAEAAELIDENKDYLQFVAKREIMENGYDYDVDICICEDEFPTKTYGRYTLPAGRYTAVKVIIGEGSGHNWWCVMFPPLCLPAAQNDVRLDDVMNESCVDIVSSQTRYEVRFKIVECIENIRARHQ